jgi:hypothetical protein
VTYLARNSRKGFLSLKSLAFITLLLLTFASSAALLQVGKNFTAAIYSESGAVPPDAALGVGTNHLVEMVNGRYSVYSKSTGARVQTSTDRNFWISAGVSFASGTSISDPRVVFDFSSQRWFASMVDVPSSEMSNRFLVAISATADPTGTWKSVAFPADPVHGYFADFPTFGVDANGVYLSGDMFDSVGNPRGPGLVSIPKNDLLASTPTATNRTSFGVLNYTSYGDILQPAVTLGAVSGGGSVLAMGDLGYDFAQHSNIVAVTIQNAGGPGATLGSPTSISVPAYEVPIDPDQLGSNNQIPDGDTRFSAIVYRVGNLIYAVHSTEVSNRAAIQWFKLDALTSAVLDTGIITDPALDLFYPAIAANSDGGVVIVFNTSSASSYVGSYAMLGEPINGTLSFGNLVLLKAGVAGYNGPPGAPLRWGDYSAAVLDPVDPSHFWALTMYPSSSTAWATQITELIAVPVSLSITNSGGSIVLSWPGAASDYQLQSTPGSSPVNWTDVLQSPTSINNQLTVSLPVTGDAQFFRLVK